jgi:hypothetical protein
MPRFLNNTLLLKPLDIEQHFYSWNKDHLDST